MKTIPASEALPVDVINPTLTLPVIVAAYVFLLLGGVYVGGFGTALNEIQKTFFIPDNQLGWLAGSNALGTIVGNASRNVFAKLPLRLGVGMGTSAIIYGLMMIVFALLHSTVAAIICLFFLGYGMGSFQPMFAGTMSRGFGKNSGRNMAILTTAFSMGAIIGPTLIGLMGGTNYKKLFIVCGLLSLMVAPFFWKVEENKISDAATTSNHSPQQFLILICSFALFYVAAESTNSLWLVTQLQELFLWRERPAAFVGSTFWICLTAGRIVVAPFSARYKETTIVIAGLAIALLGGVLIFFGGSAALGYGLLGLGLGPVFPLSLVMVAKHAPGITPYFFISANLGAMLSAPIVGYAKAQFGPSAIAPSIFIFVLLTLLALLMLRKFLALKAE